MTFNKPFKISNNLLAIIFLIVSFVGFLDATYLTIEHYRGVIPPCTILAGCGNVTTSKFALIAGVPVALLGAIYYLSIFILSVLYLDCKKKSFLQLTAKLTIIGFLASAYFVYLQLFVIGYICLYCMFSAATSTLLFINGYIVFLFNKVYKTNSLL